MESGLICSAGEFPIEQTTRFPIYVVNTSWKRGRTTDSLGVFTSLRKAKKAAKEHVAAIDDMEATVCKYDSFHAWQDGSEQEIVTYT